jgi:transposase
VLVEKTAENFTLQEVPADKGYLSKDNLELIASMGGTAYIPFKSNSRYGETSGIWEKMFFYFMVRRDEFLSRYHQRSNVESTFSAIKRKFGDSVRSKGDVAMKNECLCKILAHNVCVCIAEWYALGIEPVFNTRPACTNNETPAQIIRFPGA